MRLLKWFIGLFNTGIYLGGHKVSLKCAEEITEHLLAGKKVNAIKALRAHTGLGLKESKATIDGLECPTVAQVAEAVGEFVEVEEVDELNFDDDQQMIDDLLTQPQTIGDLIKDQMEPHLTESQMAGDFEAAVNEAAIEALTETAAELSAEMGAEDEARQGALK